jgi:hypothetical protein
MALGAMLGVERLTGFDGGPCAGAVPTDPAERKPQWSCAMRPWCGPHL